MGASSQMQADVTAVDMDRPPVHEQVCADKVGENGHLRAHAQPLPAEVDSPPAECVSPTEVPTEDGRLEDVPTEEPLLTEIPTEEPPQTEVGSPYEERNTE